MGYRTDLTGKFGVQFKVSEKFLRWFETWCRMRHMPRLKMALRKIDADWADKTPAGDLGSEAVLYACEDEGPNRYDLLDKNVRIVGQEDFYFPLRVKVNEETEKELEELEKQRKEDVKRGREPIPVGVVPEFDIWLEASPLEKTCGISNWLRFMLGCKDIMNQIGEVTGAMLEIGEEFADATYYVISSGELFVCNAYSEDAKKKVESFLTGKSCEGFALRMFEQVYKSPMELEYEWDTDEDEED